MNITKIGLVIGAAAILSACSVTQDLQDLRTVERQGSDFSKALAAEYLIFAESEAVQADWRDQGYFARKGLAAARVETVLPETLDGWNLPESHVQELTTARAELLGLLDGNARTRFPQDAARAQVKFDCWVEQQEEDHQPVDIAACKDEFQVEMEKLRGLMQPVAAPAPAPAARPGPSNFLVFFDFNSATITPEAENNLRLAVQQAAGYQGGAAVTIVGHTDLSGSVDYNRALGMRRAEAVAAKLSELGLKESAISILSLGESEPLVLTDDGVREPQNRRAAVTLQ